MLLGGSSFSMLHLLRSCTSLKGLRTCGMGGHGLGCNNPHDKNNMDSSEIDHPLEAKINNASK